MTRSERLEAELGKTIDRLVREYADLGEELPWTVTRALIHRAVHYSMESDGVEFCALATYLGEMLGHAHTLAHGENPSAPEHKDQLH
ncbi:MAG TPA: hypothetical protein VKN99_20940 [Polyangia bacterium]|nr:hypothetical protein [Polyangia bacterium]